MEPYQKRTVDASLLSIALEYADALTPLTPTLACVMAAEIRRLHASRVSVTDTSEHVERGLLLAEAGASMDTEAALAMAAEILRLRASVASLRADHKTVSDENRALRTPQNAIGPVPGTPVITRLRVAFTARCRGECGREHDYITDSRNPDAEIAAHEYLSDIGWADGMCPKCWDSLPRDEREY